MGACGWDPFLLFFLFSLRGLHEVIIQGLQKGFFLFLILTPLCSARQGPGAGGRVTEGAGGDSTSRIPSPKSPAFHPLPQKPGDGLGGSCPTHPTAVPDGLVVTGGGQHTYSTPRNLSAPQGKSMPEPCRMRPWELQACRKMGPRGQDYGVEGMGRQPR